MSEMLGNFYFHQRKFLSAQRQLEISLKSNPSDLIKKKLIICYTQSSEIEKALQMLYEMICGDIYSIAGTNIKEENCPCAELIFELENKLNTNNDNYNQLVTLGILWMYCDIKKSYDYLLRAKKLSRDKTILNNVIKIISDHLINYNLHKLNN